MKCCCFVFPPVDVDLHLHTTAEGTAHDPDPGPTHHVCSQHNSVILFHSISKFRYSFNLHTYQRVYIYLINIYVLSFLYLQVTTEQCEESQQQIQCYCLNACFLCLFVCFLPYYVCEKPSFSENAICLSTTTSVVI